jgi:hypothetical protein
MRVDTAKTQNKEVHVSKMIKLLTLVAVVAVIALPTVVLAQEKGTPVGEKPYANGDAIKTWEKVKATFDLGGTEVTVAGFTVKRAVTAEPEGQFFYKENNTYWTWKEGYTVTAPTEAKELGYFTIRYGEAPTAPQPKIYKATPPPTEPAAPKTGWKRGVEPILRPKK